MTASAVEPVLPCDLSLWPFIQELLLQLAVEPTATSACSSTDSVMAVLSRLRRTCAVAVAARPNANPPLEDSSLLSALRSAIETRGVSFLSLTLPGMARFALSLKELRPRKSAGIAYCLSAPAPSKPSAHPRVSVVEERALDRRFVASLLANAFFATLPSRVESRLALLPRATQDLRLVSCVDADEAAFRRRIDCLLTYFEIVCGEEPCGHVHFQRCLVHNVDESAVECATPASKPLCDIRFRASDDKVGPSADVLLLRRLPRIEDPALAHVPEVLSSILFMEPLRSHELLVISGLLDARRPPRQSPSQPVAHIHDVPSADQGEDASRLLRRLTPLMRMAMTTWRNLRAEEQLERSSCVSSKSSALERLADDLAMMVGSTARHDSSTKSEEPQVAQTDVEDAVMEDDDDDDDDFERRLKASLARGNTPDSEGEHPPHIEVPHHSKRQEPDRAVDALCARFKLEAGYEAALRILVADDNFPLAPSVLRRRRARSVTLGNPILDPLAEFDNQLKSPPTFVRHLKCKWPSCCHIGLISENPGAPPLRNREEDLVGGSVHYFLPASASFSPQLVSALWLSASLAGVRSLVVQLAHPREDRDQFERLVTAARLRAWTTRELEAASKSINALNDLITAPYKETTIW